MSNQELKTKLNEFFERHAHQDLTSQQNAEIFKNLYSQFLNDQHHIDWSSWKFINEEHQVTLRELPLFDKARKDVVNKLAVIKLNGGLGTTMGCTKAKSLIEVRDGYTFMDLAVLEHEKMCQLYGVDIPLYLMNSFYTDDDTKSYLSLKGYDKVRTFVQSKCPRLDAQTKLPVDDESWGDDAWCPPGHGNIFQSLQNTGVLDQLLSQGREIIFVSNIDNTGANADFQIVQLMLDNHVDYVMECTPKTHVDVKGGTLIEINNQMMHLEMPQVPPEHLPDFCSTKTFKIFNTNNIWVNLKAVKNRLPDIKSEIIVNKKKVRGREVLQLEFSIGGCIKNFANALCVHVERSRFRPVKNLGDFLSLRSSLCDLDTDTFQIHHNDTMGVPPVISMDSSVYTSVEEVNMKFPYPLIFKNCQEFNVIGDVAFGKNVQLTGKVTVEVEIQQKYVVPDGTVLNNQHLILKRS
ncbi:hypothetical protein L5515_016182 [Caenorhabditis briggsae]|uniref:UTP--glucose-1-phosphate uridylyltransferase n=1 Tax=Caenorhabditis briggsae TaxID=6238 RepID=A0AAE9F589_CAEBR|nr:hypothetical protein L5515_016182 [Caenorhabditis briggsae]